MSLDAKDGPAVIEITQSVFNHSQLKILGTGKKILVHTDVL